ncbi:ABC transporter permease [Rhodococcus opacus]|uniref:ABC transporter permease n=1 Tax=Rhodococcus opacus TaxID=37919 RepID=UPI002235932B|nr:ABC transporter permease [Rhodococcus opacus]UZG59632.1 ABC transporter permease [Rhodococcus opacus]
MSVLGRFLEDRRRSMVWWSGGVAAYVGVNNAFYPTIKNVTGIENLVKDLPDAFKTLIGSSDQILITSPAGYLQGRLFGLILPVLLLIFAVGAGAYAIGGSEEDGTLELLLSNPVTRGRVLIERFVAVVALSLGLGIVATASLLAFSPPFGLLGGVSIPGLVAAVFAATVFGLMHGAIAFAAGAWTGRRSVAIATAATVAVAGNLLNAVAASSESFHFLRFASPWHWYGGRNMLAQGIALEPFLAPIAVSVVCAAVAWWSFRRRDLH